MIKVASCQRLNISKSKTSRLRNPTQIIKLTSCDQLMTRPWYIVTQSTSEKKFQVRNITTSKPDTYDQGIQLPSTHAPNLVDFYPVNLQNKISKSETSWLQNPTQIIKIDSYHQCIPQPCNIVTKEGIGPVCAIVCILRKLYLTDNSSRDFWKSWQSGQKSELIISNEIWQHIFRSNLELDQYFHIFLFSYLPGLYFVSSYLLKYTLNLKRGRSSNLL